MTIGFYLLDKSNQGHLTTPSSLCLSVGHIPANVYGISSCIFGILVVLLLLLDLEVSLRCFFFIGCDASTSFSEHSLPTI